MSIEYLGCAYSHDLQINLNGKDKKILAMKWLVYFSDCSWKTYQVTIYNQKKNGTFSKKLSKKNQKENETSYIQINNLEAVKHLQNKDDTIKKVVKTRYTETTDKPYPPNIDEESHCIDPNAFVDTKKNLFLSGHPNYFHIKEYLAQYIAEELPRERFLPKHTDNKEKEKPENAPPATAPATELALTPATDAPFPQANKIQPLSYCCNLKVLTGLIIAISAALIAKFTLESQSF